MSELVSDTRLLSTTPMMLDAGTDGCHGDAVANGRRTWKSGVKEGLWKASPTKRGCAVQIAVEI